MAAASFTPVAELELFCRSCNKVMPCQLERSIAGSGRTVDKQSTFEYFCTKCHHTACYTGEDLLESTDESAEQENEHRDYSAKEHYLVGEKIKHPSFEETGVIVGKNAGSPSTILVQFEKSGLKKLVEEVGSQK
jgi:hypothetical protein